MAHQILRRRKRLKQVQSALKENATLQMGIATSRLRRALAVITAIEFCGEKGADIDYSLLAFCAGEQIDRSLEILSAFLPKRPEMNHE
jgi:hypothetical protein